MRRVGGACCAVTLCLTTLGCAGESAETTASLRDGPQMSWRLPSRLREISALAMTPDQRLFAVDDERAVVYQIDYTDGGLVKAFAFGEPVLSGDFEGLAVRDGRFYLMTSKAVIYVAAEGDDGEHVPYERFDTGAGDQCEFEGLSTDPQGPGLLLLCKEVRGRSDLDQVAVFTWQPGARAGLRFPLPVAEIAARIQETKLHPSAMTVHPHRRSLVIVAARQQALIEVSADGAFENALVLPQKEHHPQTEGIEFTADGAMILADEGRTGRARLTVYAP